RSPQDSAYQQQQEQPVVQETASYQNPLPQFAPEPTTATPARYEEPESSLEMDAFAAGSSICPEDGNFAMAECSRVFRVCKNGVQSFSECPNGYFFNSLLGACADHCNVVMADPGNTYKAVVPEPIQDVPVASKQYGGPYYVEQPSYEPSTPAPRDYVTEPPSYP